MLSFLCSTFDPRVYPYSFIIILKGHFNIIFELFVCLLPFCRLVSTMMTCLDTLLLLQTQYSILDVLLKAQDENVTEEGSVL